MTREPWSEIDIAKLRVIYPVASQTELVATFGRPMKSIYRKAHKEGLRRPHSGFKLGSTVGREFRFRPGQVPPNKGLRRPGWYSGRMRETQFKKGQRTGIAARNWVPVGTILPDSDGYLRIKVREAVFGKEPTGWGNPDVWPQYHRYIWKQHHGPIPPKHLVVFKDRDKSNCAIENLELITMAENASRNQMWNCLPRDLAEAIHLNAQLKRKIKRSLHGKE